MNWRGDIMVALLLEVLVLCLFGQALNLYYGDFREFEAAVLSVQWMPMVCIAVWCGSFIFLTFSLNDLPLIGLLIIAIFAYFIGYTAASTATDAIILLGGVTLGRGARVLLMKKEEGRIQKRSEGYYFLIGLVVLLAFSSWWHLEPTGSYHGSRWMGLWYNPNIYGMLMGAGFVIATGLLAAKECNEHKDANSPRPFFKSLHSFAAKDVSVVLFIVAGMMGVGLFFSYSRGAWFGVAISLLYLAKKHGKFKWRFVLPGIFVVAAVVIFFWHHTADTDQWYLKRLDFSRPSAQHRVSAWRGALQMMRDHPLGVGWNKAVETYDKNYSPPENGASAITMNSYLMLGTELGLPGLICFITYVAFRLRSPKSKVQSLNSQSAREDARPTTLDIGHWNLDSTHVACRAGALVLLVAFWFDGGLFDLPTATVFWILLELGTEVRPFSIPLI
jgi:hypothetical protein